MAIRHDEVMLVKGRWTQVGLSIRSGKGKPRYAVFKCKCGVQKVIPVYQVQAGRSTSCGCYHADVRKMQFTTHGMSSDRVFRWWIDAAIKNIRHMQTMVVEGLQYAKDG